MDKCSVLCGIVVLNECIVRGRLVSPDDANPDGRGPD
jgi:hypothetical protein